jgi:amino acid adenylation domain-containing protein
VVARADRWAARLTAAGIGPGDIVGVHLERSVELPVALLGIMRAGAAYLPLEPGLPPGRLQWLCADAGVRAVVTEAPDELSGLVDVTTLDVASLDELEFDVTVPEATAVDDVAYVLYTSGSTGLPKGVAVNHRALVNRLTWMTEALEIGADDAILHKTPIGFDVSVWELLLPLVTGARLVVARPGGHGEPAYLAEALRSRAVTIVHFVPSMLRAFLLDPQPGSARLRHVVCSGEQLTVALADDVAARYPRARVHNYYGPTEATIDVTAHEHTAHEHASDAPVPIGRPVSNTSVHVVDAGLRPVPANVPGELLLGGVQVAVGYLGRPRLTAERFIPDPFGAPGARLYRTGDRVRRRPDGALEFLGRMDRQAKIRGMRIEPGEVEAALRRQPGVAASVAAVRPGPAGEPWLLAWVVASPGAVVDVPATLAALRGTLPAHLVPSALLVVTELPRTASGKADIAALPDPAIIPATAGRRPPRGRVELTLARIWAEALGRPESDISATDDFFALGGNSLLAVVIAMRVRQELHRSLPVGLLMQHPTIAELAAAAGDESALRRYGTLVPLRDRGRLRPMFFVHSHGGHVFVYQQIAHYLDPRRPVYALRARGLDDDRRPFDNLPRMAAHYVELIRERQPRGPYAIAGWCLGGAVSYEMAQQLTRAGEEVDVLGIISLSAVQEMPDWEANDDAAFLGFVLAGFLPDAHDLPALAGHDNVPLDLDHMHTIGLDAQVEYVMRMARDHKALRPDVETPAEARRLFEVYHAHRTAILDYTLAPYDGQVVLFKAERNHLPDSPEGDLGWGPLAKGGLVIHHIPGTHFQLLQEPSVRVLAATLEQHLGRQTA